MNTGLDIQILYDKIYVYKAAFKDPIKFIEDANKLDKWHPWYIMGEMMCFGVIENDKNEFYYGDTFPTQREWDKLVKTKVDQSEKILAYVQQLFYSITSDYISKNNISIPNWSNTPPCLCKYETYGGAGNGFAMNYHTDYQVDREGEPGSKFAITCTMYLNDDYEGGSLLFRITNPDGSISEIDYKPSAGDVIVFPSGEPYLHGVEEIRSGEKYFLRNFWCYESEGSDEWRHGVSKFGSEEWEKILKQRRKDTKRYGAETKNDTTTIK
jgi:predicted 2-oxoglutarate/Fe(II)-dependent dioxygenase YbiX